jgi:hypothetical protein
VTCVLSALPRQPHLHVVNPSSLGPRWAVPFLVQRAPWSRWAGAGSLAVHGLLLAFAGWGMQGEYRLPTLTAAENVTRAARVRYLLGGPQPTHLGPKPQRPPARQQQPATSLEPSPQQRTPPKPASPERATPEPLLGASSVTGPATPAAIEVQELSPGVITGTGSIGPTPGPLAGSGFRPAPSVRLRAESPREVARSRRGPDRVAELVSGVGSACPELTRPAGRSHREVAVSVAFVVDTNGRVDRQTLRVIGSPNRPQTDNQFHSRIFIVGATARDRRDHLDAVSYDSLVTGDVASHVSHLAFRPAMRGGRAIRSTVLVSCQSS